MSKEIEINAVVVKIEPGDLILVADLVDDEPVWSLGEVTEMSADGIFYEILNFSSGSGLEVGNDAFTEPEGVLGLVTDLRSAMWMDDLV